MRGAIISVVSICSCTIPDRGQGHGLSRFLARDLSKRHKMPPLRFRRGRVIQDKALPSKAFFLEIDRRSGWPKA